MAIALKITGIIGISLLAIFLLKQSLLYRVKEVQVEEVRNDPPKEAEANNVYVATSTALAGEKTVPPAPAKTPQKENRVPIVTEKLNLPPVPPPAPPSSAPKPSTPALSPPAATLTPQTALPPMSPTLTPPLPAPALPPLDEEALLRAVVKIECPTADGRGKYIGSGFVISGDRVITAAHVIMDSGSKNCTVIFPRERRPVHYLKGVIQDFTSVTKRHNEEGIDVALLNLLPLAEYDDARAIFPKGYPFIPYSICENPAMIGDRLLHFGYPSSFLDQTYLQGSKGEAILYADINGIKDQVSADGESTFKSPIFEYTKDDSAMHPYMVSRVPTFYGDSGGLAFNAVKQCILGPHRGGTIGGGSGENYSVFPLLGWERIMMIVGN